MLGVAHVLYALLKICQLSPPEMLFKQLKKHIKLRTGKVKVLAFVKPAISRSCAARKIRSEETCDFSTISSRP